MAQFLGGNEVGRGCRKPVGNTAEICKDILPWSSLGTGMSLRLGGNEGRPII